MSFPYLPGIPPLLNPGPAGLATLVAPLISKLLNILSPKWGIYKKAGLGLTLAITPDSFVSIDYTNTANISNYPIEQGGFAAYNKVQNPRSWMITINKGGSKTDLQSFIDTLEDMQASLDLYTILTPNKIFINANIEQITYRRDAQNGAGMISAQIHFVEIKQAQASYSAPGKASAKNTKSPTSQAQQNNGQVQAKPIPFAASYKAQ
jgi:hypothetical protein